MLSARARTGAYPVIRPRVILGPPGCGKTRRLLDLLDQAFGFIRQTFIGTVEAKVQGQAFLLSTLLAVLASFILYRLRYSLFAMNIRQHDSRPARRIVIMGLSVTGAKRGAKR